MSWLDFCCWGTAVVLTIGGLVWYFAVRSNSNIGKLGPPYIDDHYNY